MSWINLRALQCQGLAVNLEGLLQLHDLALGSEPGIEGKVKGKRRQNVRFAGIGTEICFLHRRFVGLQLHLVVLIGILIDVQKKGQALRHIQLHKIHRHLPKLSVGRAV
ncbi:hypothetical protein SDC9_159356 [bioreactor metagenome]|uniref:Uncharacterized protein n=1 Tax=bioreactor metagenome TaxID=1076179 RepID=A0A645FEM1_9ZZZZ